MAVVSLFSGSNMATVMSGENQEYFGKHTPLGHNFFRTFLYVRGAFKLHL